MRLKRAAVLTSKKSWFVPHAKRLVGILKERGLGSRLFFNHEDISGAYEAVFALSYFRIMDRGSLARHDHNIIVHESRLPEGRGWAPLFWQILEGKRNIPMVLFEAAEDTDSGRIYIKDFIRYKGHELHGEIRKKQAEKTIKMCLKFITDYHKLKARPQGGKAFVYRRRTPQDSKLNIDESLKKQFNLLRIVDNEAFPAFFDYKAHRYVLKIYKEGRIEA